MQKEPYSTYYLYLYDRKGREFLHDGKPLHKIQFSTVQTLAELIIADKRYTDFVHYRILRGKKYRETSYGVNTQAEVFSVSPDKYVR